MTTITRCTVQCCTEFTLEWGKHKIHQAWLKEWLENHENGEHQLTDDILHGFNMVIPIENSEDNQYSLFTCKHYNTETGNCMDYENRPLMCHSYGEDTPCKREGGTLKNICTKK